jgi:hypothetical protein
VAPSKPWCRGKKQELFSKNLAASANFGAFWGSMRGRCVGYRYIADGQLTLQLSTKRPICSSSPSSVVSSHLFCLCELYRIVLVHRCSTEHTWQLVETVGANPRRYSESRSTFCCVSSIISGIHTRHKFLSKHQQRCIVIALRLRSRSPRKRRTTAPTARR